MLSANCIKPTIYVTQFHEIAGIALSRDLSFPRDCDHQKTRRTGDLDDEGRIDDPKPA
jgi:hypothetical protein